MRAIGDASQDLVDATSVLLYSATVSSEDGIIDEDEAADLLAKEELVTSTIRGLAAAFDGARRKFGTPVSKELMNESFFVFCLSKFARLTVEYSSTLRLRPPKGKNFAKEFKNNIRELITIPLWYHYRVVSRYWLSLMLCFLFSAYMDNFVPSCAITGVFLINTRVGPDVMAMIQGLLAVVVGIVTNALMYSFSCRFGNTKVLMVVSVFYWLVTLTVGKGTSSIANIGLLMAALSPFALFKFCEPSTPAVQAANAIGLWTGIRALLIAVTITISMEFCHIPGLFSRLSKDALNEAFVGMQNAFHNVWPEEYVKEAKKVVDRSLALAGSKADDAETYNLACLMEPRLWMCPWKGQLLVETCGHIRKLRLDVLLIRQALNGLDGKMEDLVDLMNKVPEVAHMKKDLHDTLEDARELIQALMEHNSGKFKGLEDVGTVMGIDVLDSYEEAIKGQNKFVSFPATVPETLEDDACVRISIVYVMMDYVVKHVAEILKSGIKLA
jgi:hypothetical protein